MFGQGKKILVGVTGGIAAYKTAFLIRELKKLGAQVRVMMTDSATRFVAPLTFETLAESAVAVELFSGAHSVATAHIDWARWPDLIVICPASANTIAKIAHGFADNMLTTTVLASKAPLLICPAMNVEMYKNPLYRQNEETLKRAGCIVVAPGEGELACGETGIGRLAELEDILDAVAYALTPHTLSGRKVLVTAGPTREAIDPVRFLSNRSSGKMGYALAECAAWRGAEVTLISGPSSLRPSLRWTFKAIETVSQMAESVEASLPNTDVLIMAAAPADFAPVAAAPQKIKKSASLQLQLEKTPDILKTVGQIKGKRLLVGFALETEHGIENARRKLVEKNCDLMVLNHALTPGAGFEVETNQVTLLFADGAIEELPMISKRQTAQQILNAVETLLAQKSKP